MEDRLQAGKPTGGQIADRMTRAELLARMPACDILHDSKSDDSDVLRRQIENGEAAPNTLPKVSKKWKNCLPVPWLRSQLPNLRYVFN
jgi:hypothetical protein